MYLIMRLHVICRNYKINNVNAVNAVNKGVHNYYRYISIFTSTICK